MGRPRLEPMRYETLKQKIQSRSDQGAYIRRGPESRPERMKSYLLRVVRELSVPVTVRRVPRGMICWRSSEEDIQQAQETTSRLQTAQRYRKARPGRRRA